MTHGLHPITTRLLTPHKTHGDSVLYSLSTLTLSTKYMQGTNATGKASPWLFKSAICTGSKPPQPREEHKFPKASTSDKKKKIPYRTESEDKVEVCTCWVPGKTCCLIPCTLAIQPFIKVTSLWCLQIFGTWIRTYILWLITNIHTHCLKKCTELFLWPRWVDNPLWLNSLNPPIQSAEASVLKGTGELCWARVDVGNNTQNDRRHHHFVHSVNIFASLPCGSVPCIRI